MAPADRRRVEELGTRIWIRAEDSPPPVDPALARCLGRPWPPAGWSSSPTTTPPGGRRGAAWNLTCSLAGASTGTWSAGAASVEVRAGSGSTASAPRTSHRSPSRSATLPSSGHPRATPTPSVGDDGGGSRGRPAAEVGGPAQQVVDDLPDRPGRVQRRARGTSSCVRCRRRTRSHCSAVAPNSSVPARPASRRRNVSSSTRRTTTRSNRSRNRAQFREPPQKNVRPAVGSAASSRTASSRHRWCVCRGGPAVGSPVIGSPW